MAISEQQLKKYAKNIYNNVPGYTLDKVYKLAPRYAPIIQTYLLEFTIEEEQSFLRNTTATILTLEFLAVYFKQKQKEFEALKKTVIIYQSKLEKMNLDEEESKSILIKNQLLYIDVYKKAIEWREVAIDKADYLGERNMIQEYQKSINSYNLLIAKANKKLKELI